MQYAADHEWTGLISDRYALRGVIGHGGMGEVWAADDLLLDRTVAVKLMHPQLAFDDMAQSRFQRETRAAASLNHPCITAVYDAGWLRTAPPRPYLVMEHLEGETAADRLRIAPPTLEEAIAWTAGILEALACAHEAGLVHRDIKPANVMITPGGRIKVMDFGIAHVIGTPDTALTGVGNVLGTVAYMSPEQASGNQVDARSDLYSAGCMLYEFLTGRQPYEGDTPFTIAYQHIFGDIPAPGALGVQIPEHIEKALARAMAKRPDDRFPTARAMSDALLVPGGTIADLAATRLEAAAHPREQDTVLLDPPAEPRLSFRRRVHVALSGAFVLAAGALLTLSLLPTPDTSPATEPTTHPPTSAEAASQRAGAPAATTSARPRRSTSPDTANSTSARSHSQVIRVPYDLVGETLAQARAELARLGLTIALAPGSSSDPGSTVMATAPAAGTEMVSGDTVVLATGESQGSPPASGVPSSGASASPTTQQPSAGGAPPLPPGP